MNIAFNQKGINRRSYMMRRRPYRGRFYRKITKIAKRTMLNQSEVKIVSAALDLNTNTYAAEMQEMPFLFSPGTGKASIIGRRIKYKMLTVKGTVFATKEITSSTTNIPAINVRLIFFQFRQQFDDTKPLNVLYQGTESTAFWNHPHPNNVRVLRDFLVTLGASNVAAQSVPSISMPSALPINFAVKIHNEVAVNVETNKPTDPVDRYGVFIAGVGANSTNGDGTTYKVYFNGGASISFYDI